MPEAAYTPEHLPATVEASQTYLYLNKVEAGQTVDPVKFCINLNDLPYYASALSRVCEKSAGHPSKIPGHPSSHPFERDS